MESDLRRWIRLVESSYNDGDDEDEKMRTRIDLISEAVDPVITSPKNGGHSFLASLFRLRLHQDPNGHDGTSGKDYKDNHNGNALRARLVVDMRWMQFLQKAMPQIKAAGWHLAVKTKRSKNEFALVFEPSEPTRAPKFGGIFWHISPSKNIASIKQHGLIPGNSRHDYIYTSPRIYLVRMRENAIRAAQMFHDHEQVKIDYSLFRVDLRRAKIQLFIDHALPSDSVFTTNPIPPQYIELISETMETRN